MAMKVRSLLMGVDVAKDELVICQSWSSDLVTLANEDEAIRVYLESLPGPTSLAVEATNVFHVALVERAHALGHAVYVIDGLRLKRYRESVGGRAKNDACDARLLLRYLSHEIEDLRVWTPPPNGYATLQGLLHRRAVLVQTRTALRQSLKSLPDLRDAVTQVLDALAHLDRLIQKQVQRALQQAGWKDDATCCRAIEGIGPVTAAAVTMAFHRGTFKSSDAFIAFIGMDVRVRDSGQQRGRRKLTKKGDPELRRLLYMAAMAACRSATWKDFYERAIARGLTRIQALVALARKLARIAFALIKNHSQYQPKSPQIACVRT